jgi:inosine-uridine nucleoside N-ribohydrolase
MEAGNSASINSSSTFSSGRIAGRKEGLPHVGKRSDLSAWQPSRQYSFPAWFDRMRLRWSTRSQRPTRTMIPQGLSEKEISHYETLINVVKARPGPDIKKPKEQPRVVVITDLAKDYDDLAAMVVLKELHRLGVVKLLGFIANLMPAEKRTQFGRGALDSLGLESIPIAQGTSGFPEKARKKHDELAYEFDCDFMATDERIDREFKGNGEDLLHQLCEEAVKTKQELTLVLISSLEDIYTFSSMYPDLLKTAVSKIVLQGGYTVSPNGKLEPDESANNNRYDMEAAKYFHTFMQDNKIPSTVYTKVAAFATPLTSKLFAEMAETNHPLGKHLRKVQVEQDLSFYKTASNPDPELRFAPFMDQEWFLKNKTSWFDSEPPKSTAYPEEQEVIPWLTKVIVYDALAALGASGLDALRALRVLTHNDTEPHSIHQIVGFAGPPSDPGVDSDQMCSVLSALLKGSLLSCPAHGNR